MRAQDHLQAGQLKEAIAAAIEEVKKQPADTGRRGFLCELQCFAGELEKADNQLDTISHQDPQAALGVSLFRQLIRAEQARQHFFNEGRLPEFLDQPGPALKLCLEASILLRDGKATEARKVLEQAEDQRPKVKGACNGKAFEDLRDLDDLCAPFFEVLTSTGKYYWIPVDRVEHAEFRPPTRPRDLIWARAHMSVRNGPDGEVYLPVLYAGSHADPDPRIQLGRATDWKAADSSPVRGIGQRTFLVGDESLAILELKEISFAG